jgi:hypothetical protein
MPCYTKVKEEMLRQLTTGPTFHDFIRSIIAYMYIINTNLFLLSDFINMFGNGRYLKYEVNSHFTSLNPHPRKVLATKDTKATQVAF